MTRSALIRRHRHVVSVMSQFRAGIRAPAVGKIEFKKGSDSGVFSELRDQSVCLGPWRAFFADGTMSAHA